VTEHVRESNIRRRTLLAWAVQLALLLLAVGASGAFRGHGGVVIVMAIAGVNAVVVAVAQMGVRRDGRLPLWLALLTLVLITGLLIWPAVDVSQRARWF
jgi:uncharacterized membrane protein YhaH (DUF805 family)